MNNNIKNELKKFINNSNNQTYDSKYYLFIKLPELCIKIQNIFYDSRNIREKIIENKNNETIKKFNILFNICKKIYEARDKYLLKKIQNPITSSNSILKITNNPFRNKNYILKFIRSLDDEEYEFIKDLLDEEFKPLFIALYDIFKHTDSDKIYQSLSSIKIDNKITFLSPEIKQNKYIKIPSDNDSNIKKKYFIDLLINFDMNPIKLDELQINFLKKVLSNKNWDKFVDTYKPDEEIVYNEEIMLAYCLGILCGHNFNYIIEIISRKIIEEQKQNIKTTSENVKNAKDIVDLFEIFYLIDLNNLLINKIEREKVERKKAKIEHNRKKELRMKVKEWNKQRRNNNKRKREEKEEKTKRNKEIHRLKMQPSEQIPKQIPKEKVN